ncbi:phosphoenolpyruvate synthase [Actinocorallia sp. B10E7]|uniref:phosphoenolpyruvate synthase n=1 Tax=Actinocorallia sp. B10E7 TaxID=3153558 RepID=UPI00325D25E6
MDLVRWFDELSLKDVPVVGGKNASLGEMVRALPGIPVPNGFATTADAYREFLRSGGLDERITELLGRRATGASLAEVGTAIRELILRTPLPGPLAEAVTAAYARLGDGIEVAVRSSATAEDLPEASFAGQQETFLNVRGADAVLEAVHRCFASLFTDRAISYRGHHGFEGLDVALSVGVQPMVRSDLGAAGVLFTLDTETGFPHTLVVNASYGLGEAVVGGKVDPDEYTVFKPLLDKAPCPILTRSRGRKETKIVYAEEGTRTVETTAAEREALALTDEEILRLSRWAVRIEDHYGTPMDIEWAKDGRSGELFILQARPETVQARRQAGFLRSYRLVRAGERLLTGIAIGEAVASGKVCRLDDPADRDSFPDGAILVTADTDPDWEPIMKRAAAVVTDHGGRTSHAAIVSREVGVPAIVGTGEATRLLEAGREITVSCAEGDRGRIYAGVAEVEVQELDFSDLPRTRTKVMLNLANPAAALRWWRLPADGVGLLRMEFLVNDHVKVHPMALVHPDRVSPEDQAAIDELTRGYDAPADYFVDRLSSGIGRIAASRWPNPVIVRMSDFKTNEYARLVGGRAFEPDEANPMIGWRGASRYYSDGYRDGFALECRALRRVREQMGLSNVILMIPFCRTLTEADSVLSVLAENGLRRGEDGLRIYVMAEIPANIILAKEFAERFDGFSIGSNDLTQLTLGVDRDSAALSHLFDERDPAVLTSITRLISDGHAAGSKVGLCGQRPSDDPDFARFLVQAGIDSISVTPDSFLAVKNNVAAAEAEL